MKKVYFMLSAGWGPVIRALPVAEQLKKNGIKSVFHVSGKSIVDHLKRAGYKVHSPISIPQKGEPKQDWWTLDQLLYDFNWSDRDFVFARHKAYVQAIKTIKPDVLVVDFNTSAMLAGKVLNIPILSVVQSCFHPNRKSKYIVYWKKAPDFLPKVTESINGILSSNGLDSIEKVEDIQLGDITVIPSIPEVDPLSIKSDSCYVGPMLGNDIISGDDYSSSLSEKDMIFVYPGRPKDLGGDSGNLIMTNVLPALQKIQNKAVVSVGGFSYSDFNVSENVKIEKWVSESDIIKKCKIMIHHGGHGACLTALKNGIPSIIIPTFAEREYNARNVEKIGCALVLTPEEISPDTLISAIKKIEDGECSENVLYWKKEIESRAYKPVDDVCRFINRLF